MVNIIIPMAGNGSRFPKDKYPLPKPLIDVSGKPMIERAIKSLGFVGQWHFILRNNEFLEQTKTVLNSIVDNPKFVVVDYETAGPAASVLLFKEHINNNEPLVTANCDQIMNWNVDLFYHNVNLYDGAVVTYYADTDKNSYAKIDKDGQVVEMREKQVISNISLNGIHYWKKGKYFVDSAEAMIAANDRAPNGEFYIAPTYNYMIKENLKVGIYHIPNECHNSVGVPEDLTQFINNEKT